MRNPIAVLNSLSEKSQAKEYRFERLYRNLYNPEFYLLAYKNIYANDGSMTMGVDGTTLDGMSSRRIEGIISKIKDKSYQPHPARRTYIAKKNSTKKRPLGIPSSDDKLVQEVVRMILESIYEPTFSKNSHGFRPKRSCHTALMQIQKTFTGVTWFVEGDITACFDSFDHHVMINILRRRINDENFIGLMWKFLKAGYMEQWDYHSTYSGTPQGSGASPVLANIYLNELDMFMESYKANFDVGSSASRKINPEYERLRGNYRRYERKYAKNWNTLTEQEKRTHSASRNQMKALMRTVPSRKPCDETYKSLQYVRYADDFIVGVIGSQEDAKRVKADIAHFVSAKLKLTLSEEKTKITHTSQRARFLGYDMTVSKSQDVKRRSDGRITRAYGSVLKLYLPHEKWENKLREYGAIRIVKNEHGKDIWKAIHRGKLTNKNDIEILSKYNSEIRGFYNYYSLASNACAVGAFASLMKYSMLKTFANKYRTKVSKIKARYVVNGAFTVKYQTTTGEKQAVFYNKGYKRQVKPLFGQVDTLDYLKKYDKPNALAHKLRSKTCELCGERVESVEIHQVKRLKDLSGDEEWERIMLKKHRKTMAVCQKCHEAIHICDKT
ncbi:reverse transcriptase domain-containing protein [Bengtsoniella intestinalis]|uniref:reverse transcriptase/maturase family protein n=1 Tax=Bengtsoniella intestinalis TaxID=3073143 RepID=UPI00391F9B5E